jgi:hypothetical protein
MGEAEFLKEQMAAAKAAPAPSVKSSISSYLFGTKSTPAPTPPPVPPRSSTSDSYDYTAEARKKRSAANAAKPALDIKESISNISSGIGQKLSNLKGGAAVIGSKPAVTGSKPDEVVKKTPELSEYEKQIMAGTSLDTISTLLAVVSYLVNFLL